MSLLKKIFAPDLLVAQAKLQTAEERAAFWENRFYGAEEDLAVLREQSDIERRAAQDYTDSLIKIIVAKSSGSVVAERYPEQEPEPAQLSELSESDKELLWTRATEICEGRELLTTKANIQPIYEAMRTKPDEYLEN